MKIIHRVLGVIFGFCAFLALLYAALVPNAMNRSFYAEQFSQNLSYIEANVSETQLNTALDHVLRYLWDQEEDMQLTLTYLDATTGPAFSNRELAHMVDVKNLFTQGRRLAYGCMVLAGVILAYFIWQRKKLDYQVLHFIRATLFVILGLFALIGLYALLDFTNAFTLFHHVFFSNDLWLLNPDDLLIIMLPESLFATIAFQTLLAFFTYLVLLLLSLRFIKKRMLQMHP